MRQQNRDRRHDRSKDLADWAPVGLALIGIVLGITAGLTVLQWEADRPAVGDIVVFRSGTADRGPWRVTVTAIRLDAARRAIGSCILNSSVMAAGGGGLIVEARLPAMEAPYRVHWAGKQTDTGENDCGVAADLLLARVDLRKLATAAGGFGVKTKGIGPTALIRGDAGVP